MAGKRDGRTEAMLRAERVMESLVRSPPKPHKDVSAKGHSSSKGFGRRGPRKAKKLA